MINRFISLLVILLCSLSAFPQSEVKARRPDIPGTFVVELGINRGLEAPQSFDLGFWGSRTVNLYYQYDIRILKSRFSLVPAVGVSLERFKFRNMATLHYDAEDTLKLLTSAQGGFTGVRKSQLITNYVEVPIEIRYSSNPDDPARAFKASIGARVGYLYDSFAKIKYKADGEIRKLKDKQDWNLNQFRYGVFGKVGFGNFAVVGYYNLTNLFQDGKGLGEKFSTTGMITDFPTFTVGISLSSF